MKHCRQLLFTVIFLTFSHALAQSGKRPLEVKYTCHSNAPVHYSNGDQRFRIGPTQEMTFAPDSEMNLNLVIGSSKALIWVRQPFGTQERLLTVFRANKGVGFAVDPQEISMGNLGEYASKNLSFSFADSGRAVQVDCLVEMME